MPTFEFISPDKVPANRSRGARAFAIHAASEKLREALRTNQAIVIRLGADERPQYQTNAFSAAARALGIGVVVTIGERRPCVIERTGRETEEACLLFVRIGKRGAHANGQVENPVVRAIRIPEPTVSYPVRGMEVQR